MFLADRIDQHGRRLKGGQSPKAGLSPIIANSGQIFYDGRFCVTGEFGWATTVEHRLFSADRLGISL